MTSLLGAGRGVRNVGRTSDMTLAASGSTSHYILGKHDGGFVGEGKTRAVGLPCGALCLGVINH